MTLPELIAALEQADGPSRELFMAAYQVVHPPPNWQSYGNPQAFARFMQLLNAEAWLEAAALLVPNGWRFGLSTDGLFVRGTCRAAVWEKGPPTEIEWYAPTPALALCIAALRAREGNDAV